MRTFSSPPMAIRPSRIPFSIPLTSADIDTRLDTPRMIPSIVSSDRNLCAQISFSPTPMALKRFISIVSRDQARVDLLGDFTVPNLDSAWRVRRDLGIVGDQRDGPALLAEFFE